MATMKQFMRLASPRSDAKPSATIMFVLLALAAVSVHCQTITSVSQTTIPASGGMSLTLYGQGFPVAEPTLLVFLNSRFDVAPAATCTVDRFISTSTAAVCNAVPQLGGAAQVNVSVFQPSSTLYVGLKTTSSTTKYFFTSENVMVAITYSGPTVQYASGVLGYTPTSSVFIAIGNTTAATIFDSNMDIYAVYRGGAFSVQCEVRTPGFLTANEQASARRGLFSFQCPSTVIAGLYTLSLYINGVVAELPKRSAHGVLRYAPSMDTYTMYVAPVVTSITPSIVAGGVNVTFTIQGSGFSPNPDENTISLGGSPCTILTSTASLLVCQGMPAATTPSVPIAGGSGVLRRFFSVTQPSAGTVTVSQLRASLPVGDLTSGAAGQITPTVVSTDFDFSIDSWFASLAALSLSYPLAAIHEGYFTAAVAGTYTFYCVGGDSAVLQVFSSGSWADLCSAEASSNMTAQAFEGQPNAVSTGVALTAGQQLKLRAAFGMESATVGFARFSMSVNATAAPVNVVVATPQNTKITIAKNSDGMTSQFEIGVGSQNVPVSIPATSNCSVSVSMAQLIASASNGNWEMDESIVETASACTWYLLFQGDTASNAAVNVTSGSATVTVILAGSAAPFVDAIPAYAMVAPYDASGWGATTSLLSVTARGFAAVHTTNTASPVSVSASLTAPAACSVSPTQLVTSNLDLFVSSVSSFSVATATLDLISYNGNYASLGNLITYLNASTFKFTVPSLLSSSVYNVILDQGQYGRISCGYVVQGFQAILISPSAGTSSGGTVLTITGFNFPTQYTTDLYVSIGGSPCMPYYATATTILCITTPILASPTDTPVSTSASSTTFFVRVYANQTQLPAALVSTYSSYSAFGGALAPRYSYSLTGIPVVTSIYPNNGSSGSRNVVTISGSNLAQSAFSMCDTNMTTCTPIVCPSAFLTSTSAICTVPRLGDQVLFVVATSSLGRSNTDVNYTSVFQVDSIQPSNLAPGGGSTVTVTGSGFGTGISVSIGGGACKTTFVNDTTILCTSGPIQGTTVTPTVSYPTLSSLSASLNATVVSISTVFSGGVAPVIPFFYPYSGNGVGSTITIAAQGWPTSMTDPTMVTVMIGKTPCSVFLVDPTMASTGNSGLPVLNPPSFIYCNRTIPGPAGADLLQVWLEGFGLLTSGSLSSSIPLITTTYTHTLTVDSVYPLSGSTAGGLILTLLGMGFGNGSTPFSVTVGDVKCNAGPTYNGTYVHHDTVLCMMDPAPSLVANDTSFIVIQAREVISVFGSKFHFMTMETPLLTKASPLTGNAGTALNLGLINVDPADVVALLLVGNAIPLNYSTIDGSYNAILPSLPAFRSKLQIQTTTGLSRSASSIVFVSYPSISSISPQIANSGGGTLITINGQRFGRQDFADNLQVLVCGNVCSLISYNLTQIVCSTPPLQNLNSISASTVSELTGVAATYTGTSSTSSNLVDGDITTTAVITRGTGLAIGLDIGNYRSGHILSLSFFPTLGFEDALVGATVQTSNDASTWTTVATISTVQSGWNKITFRIQTVYAQYITIVPASSVQVVSLQEMSVRGMRGIASTALFCPLVVTMMPYGSDMMSTCLQQPLLCTNVDPSIRITFSVSYSPTVTRIQPEVGTTRGGTDVSLYGSFPIVSTTDVTIVAGGLPCTVKSVGAAQIVCTTSPNYIDMVAPQTTSLNIAGFGYASIATQPFFYAEYWSTPEAWSFAGLPTEGSIVIVPRGITVVLDVSPPPLAGLIIYGTLMTTTDVNIDIVLQSGFILIQETGALLVGTTTNPFSATLTIALAPSTITDPVFGTSFLAVVGGTISLCGLATSSVYGSLSQTAAPGDTFVSIAGITTWSAGSTIVIPTSTSSHTQTEVRTINETAINGTNTVFKFQVPLQYTHYQGVETNSLGLSASYTAVVGLISRSVVVTSVDPNRPGYVVVVPSTSGANPIVTLYYCEFSYLGQRALLRHHPLSLVNVQVPNTVTMAGVSVHDSVNRGVYFENCQHITASSMVVFNTIGHGVSTDESGMTRFITLVNNYVASAQAGELLDPDASCFYFTNPQNNISSSYAIGAAFAGFAFHLRKSTNSVSVCPQDAPFGIFTRNTAIANEIGLAVYPSHAQRTFVCGSVDPIANPTVTTTMTTLQFYLNRRRHISLGTVGSWTISASWMMDAEDASISVDGVLNGFVTFTTLHVVAHSQRMLTQGFATRNSVLGIRGIVFPSISGNVVLSSINFAGFNGSTTGIPHYAMSACEDCASPFNSAVPGYLNFGSRLLFTQVGTTAAMLLHPPYNSIFLDMDGTFNSNIANSSVLQIQPHLYNSVSGDVLPNCQPLSTSVFATIDITAAPFMICSGYSMHHVRVIGDLGGGQLSVSSLYGVTNYASYPSTRVPGLSEGTVIIPSGLITYNNFISNMSVLNFSITLGNNINWDRVVIVIPNTLATLGGQLGVKFNFTLSAYSVSVFPRTRAFSSSNLMLPSLSPSDSLVSTIPTISGLPTTLAVNTTTAFVTPQSVFLDVVSQPLSNGVPLVYDMRTTRCAAGSSCLTQTTPIANPVSYPWTDLRAWPQTGKVPVAGDIAIIPRGVYVTLQGSTAKLRALIVEGTLELHFRLTATITANFIIVNGGSIICGSTASPHQPQATINLVRDDTIPPMTVTDAITIESGTLLNMGTLQLVGAVKSVPWTSLGALLGSQSYSVTTADVLQNWNADEIVAISSSNYNNNLMERLKIGQIASDNRGFTARTPSTMQHDWYTMTINDNTKLTTAAKVAVLNRTIVIRGAGTTPGCQVLFVERTISTFPANGYMSNVEISGCGIINGSKWNSTTGAAVVLKDIQRSAVTLSQNAIHDSLASGIAFFNSQRTSVSGNAIVGTVGSSMFFDNYSPNNQITGNLVFGTAFSNEIRANPAAPAALCSYDSRYVINTFQSNVAAGSDSEGFCVQLPSCTDTTRANTGNEAHSCVVGHFTSTITDPSTTCVSINGFHGWHNSYIGIYSAVAADTMVLTSAVHDNHIQVVLGHQDSGTNTMRSSIIGGRAGYFDGLSCSLTQCVSNRLFGTCFERAELLNDGSRSFLQGEIGILVTPFLMETPSAEYSRDATALPFIRFGPNATSPAFSSNVFDANIYYYWYRGNDFGRCGGSTVVAADGFATLRLPTTMFSNSTWVTFNDDARVYIPNMIGSWSQNNQMCYGHDCDALLHVAINDQDGHFFATTSSSSAISHYSAMSRTCVENLIWNAFLCSFASVGQLTVRDFGPTLMDSYHLEPLSVREDQWENIADVNYLPPLCAAAPAQSGAPCAEKDARAHQFNPLLRLGFVYNLDFHVEAPRRLRVTLDSCADSLGRVQLNLKYPSDVHLTVWLYDGHDSIQGVPVKSSSDLILSDSPVGSYFYDSATMRLRVIMQCGYTIEVHNVVYATVAMLLQSTVEDFSWLYADAFMQNVSSYLVLNPSRISLEAVYPGSAVTLMQLVGDDVQDYQPAPSANEVNNYVLNLVGFSASQISQNLNFPVLQTVAAAWASEMPTTVPPPSIEFGLTLGLVVSISVVSGVIFLVVLFAQYRMFLAIINYSDETDAPVMEEDDEEGLLHGEDEKQAAPAPDGVEGVIAPEIRVETHTETKPTSTKRPEEDNIVAFDVDHDS